MHKLQSELLDAGIIEQHSLAKFPNLDIDEAVTK